VHIAERGHDARRFALLVTGGGGPVHGCEVARRLGIRRVICPPAAGVASALGMLVAPARIDRSGTVACPLGRMNWTALEAGYAALEADAFSVIAQTLTGEAAPAVQRLADMRFRGQGYEVITRLPAGPYTASSGNALRASFLAAYEGVFGRRPPVAEIEIVNIRVSVTAPTSSGELELDLQPADAILQPRATRTIRFHAAAAPVAAPVYERSALPAGQRLRGPAIVEEASSTLLVPPGADATLHPDGNIVIELPDS
jgi:N-methylhydantoinase A